MSSLNDRIYKWTFEGISMDWLGCLAAEMELQAEELEGDSW